jgi:penicillin-binding protein 1A
MDFSKEANEKKQKKHISKNKKIKNRVGVIIIRIVFIAVILSFFAGLGGLLGVVLGIINTAPILNAVDVIPEGYTSIIYEDKTGREIDRIHGEENREYVKLNKIPLHLQKAVIAVEDERFYEHFGIDPKGMIRAFFVNIKNKSMSEGASTLTQQLIKNRILTSEKKLKRKIQEQYLAIE